MEQIKHKSQEESQEEYISAIEKMFPKTKIGSLTHYFKQFLLVQPHDGWWSQPQVQSFCNNKVADDGGVNWNTKKGGKKNPDGTPSTYGDPGRTLEKIRRETYDECWDNQSGNTQGPFRLNIEKYIQFIGSTKCHTFSEKDKKDILKRANKICELCGYKGKLEIDHFIPREKGGKSTFANGNALCSRCNERKCNKEPNQFMMEEFTRLKKYFELRGLVSPF